MADPTSTDERPAPVRVYLASISPRRRGLLAQIGIACEVVRVQVDETPQRGEAPEPYVLRVALAKARAARLTIGPSDWPVLAADTAVVLGERVLGKPRDRSEGLAMLARLANRTHEVLTAVALLGREEQTALSRSQVSFGPIDAAQALAYWQTGEPADKAGAYGIQGLGGRFVRHLAGSYSGVMGLPLYETTVLLAREGIDPLSCPQRAEPP